MTLGLAKQNERLAKALAETGINEKQQPLEYRAQAQVLIILRKLTHQLCFVYKIKVVYTDVCCCTDNASPGATLCCWPVNSASCLFKTDVIM